MKNKKIILGVVLGVVLVVFGVLIKNKAEYVGGYVRECEKMGGVILSDDRCYIWGVGGSVRGLNFEVVEKLKK